MPRVKCRRSLYPLHGNLPRSIEEQPWDGKIGAFLKLIDAYAASVVLTYLSNPKDQAKIIALADPARAGRSEVMGDRRPASTLIVGRLANPAWKIEIEGIAVA